MQDILQAALRAMNSIGVITRCVAPALRGDFTRCATLPSGSTLTRPLATAGRAM